MFTASLDVNRTWVTLADNPSGPAVICGSTQSSPTVAALDGDLIEYAGGRVSARLGDQDDLTLSYTLAYLAPADVTQLIAWRGQTVLLRTMEGERAFCVYFAVPYSRALRSSDVDTDANVTFSAEITFQRVSYDETA